MPYKKALKKVTYDSHDTAFVERRIRIEIAVGAYSISALPTPPSPVDISPSRDINDTDA